ADFFPNKIRFFRPGLCARNSKLKGELQSVAQSPEAAPDELGFVGCRRCKLPFHSVQQFPDRGVGELSDYFSRLPFQQPVKAEDDKLMGRAGEVEADSQQGTGEVLIY